MGQEVLTTLTKLQLSLVLFFRKKHYLQYYNFFYHNKLSCAFSLHASVQYLRDTTRRQKAYFSTIAKDLRWNYFCRRVPSFISDRVINMAPNRLLSAGINLLKVNNRNTRKRCEICSKVRIRTPERHHVVVVSLLILNIFHTLL